jgi:hypothetical protein
MPHLDAVADELRALAAGVEQARSGATVADSQVEEIATRAALSGFAGVALGVVRIRQAISELRARLGIVGTAVSEAVAVVTAAPRETSPQDTVAVLSGAAEKLAAARDGLVAALGMVDETQRSVVAVLRGGQPGPMVVTLDGLRQALAEQVQRCAAAERQVGVAIAAARQTGGVGS